MTIKQIQLNPIEATAYFWVNTIKNKVREISINTKKFNEKEKEFLKIFYNYTDLEWRKVYLELIKYTDYKVKKYVPHGMYGIDDYNQDTAKYYHNDINKILSQVTSKKIPDIRLENRDIKDSIIYTNAYGANRWYKSCGTVPLPSLYESNYILTGNKKELDFYNLVIAVTTVVMQKNNSFNSVNKLRKIFCDIYIEIYGETDRKVLEEQFNNILYKMNDKGLIIGTPLQQDYYCKFQKIDLVGLDSYKDVLNDEMILKKISK